MTEAPDNQIEYEQPGNRSEPLPEGADTFLDVLMEAYYWGTLLRLKGEEWRKYSMMQDDPETQREFLEQIKDGRRRMREDVWQEAA